MTQTYKENAMDVQYTYVRRSRRVRIELEDRQDQQEYQALMDKIDRDDKKCMYCGWLIATVGFGFVTLISYCIG